MPASFICFQVINIINAAQENSPITVAEALDRVLEILRTTELYSPQLGTKDEDPHTSDLVGGLMNVSKISKDEIAAISVLHHSSVLCCVKISQAMGRGLVINSSLFQLSVLASSLAVMQDIVSYGHISVHWVHSSLHTSEQTCHQKLYPISQKILKGILYRNSRSLYGISRIAL